MKALTVSIHPISSSCDMRCAYCFFADFGEGKGAKNYGAMSRETLEETVGKSLAATEKVCTFEFQGGEPTLAGLDFFRQLVAFEKEHNPNGVEIRHSLVTNGLSIDDDWAAFLAENGFLTTISLDTGKNHHDAMRPDAEGKGTHNRSLDAFRILQKHGADTNVAAVVTKALGSHPDKTYRYYTERGFRHLQFIPCLDRPGEVPKPFSLDAGIYGKFLCRIFDIWHKDFIAGDYCSIGMFDRLVHILAGQLPDTCAVSGRGRACLAVEGDGSVHPVDYHLNPGEALGDIKTTEIGALIAADRARFADLPPEAAMAHPDCLECMYFEPCGGGDRMEWAPPENGVPGLSFLCESYKTFYAHALPRLRELARKLYTIYDT